MVFSSFLSVLLMPIFSPCDSSQESFNVIYISTLTSPTLVLSLAVPKKPRQILWWCGQTPVDMWIMWQPDLIWLSSSCWSHPRWRPTDRSGARASKITRLSDPGFQQLLTRKIRRSTSGSKLGYLFLMYVFILLHLHSIFCVLNLFYFIFFLDKWKLKRRCYLVKNSPNLMETRL